MDYFLGFVSMIVSVLLIGVILLQRGRGGGLIGSLSGLGGQSAFGTKAGDVFTRITIVIAFVWVIVHGIHGQVLRAKTAKFKNDTSASSPEMGSTAKDKDADASKAAELKKDADSASSKDGAAKDADAKPDSKQPAESTKELTPDDDKKSDAAPKSPEPPKKELNESSDEKKSSSDEKK